MNQVTEDLRGALAAERRAAACERDLADHFLSVPARPDWEQLIASGVVPALALGAERRLNRHYL